VEDQLQQLLLNCSLSTLNKKEQQICIEKILQNHTWKQIGKKHNYTGNKAVREVIKKCIINLLGHC
jgi:tRNA(Met) C34 N-acetyltransferase TmcA